MAKANKTDSYIPWQQWQRHDDAAEAYHRTLARGDAGGLVQPSRDSNIVQVQNNSGADRAKGHVLEFTGYYLAEAKMATGYGWLVGGSPSLANDFGILLQPIKSGKLGDCQLAGSCYALVNVNDADDRYARVTASTYVLQSAAVGPVRIVHKPSGTGEKGCWVRLDCSQSQIFYGKPAGSYSVNGTGTINLWDPAFSGALNTSIASVNIRVRDMTTATRVIGNVVDGVANAFPIDCEDA